MQEDLKWLVLLVQICPVHPQLHQDFQRAPSVGQRPEVRHLRLQELHPLRLDALEDLGVVVYGPDPHAEGAGGPGDLANLVRDELGVVYVPPNPLAHMLRNVVLEEEI